MRRGTALTDKTRSDEIGVDKNGTRIRFSMVTFGMSAGRFLFFAPLEFARLFAATDAVRMRFAHKTTEKPL